jgi:HPt (histidine-containing phosphotransfer) domain-containing protein
MADDLEKKLLAGTAYRIFCDELSKHMEATRTLFITGDWTPEQLRDASNRFHTIKGGAGFFRLTSVAVLAGQLENLLGEKDTAELTQRLETLRDLDTKLRSAVSEIPAPRQS